MRAVPLDWGNGRSNYSVRCASKLKPKPLPHYLAGERGARFAEAQMGKRWEHGSWAEYYQIQARKEGKTQAFRDVLKRQLGRRFGGIPKPIVATIDLASAEHLESWIDRVIDAPVVDAVFSD